MIIERLHERHLPLVDAFSCTETSEMLADLKADERRRVRKHSKEMEDFLHEEAFSEQELGMSTTYLVLDDGSSQILAYISLCNDAINLEFQERTDSGITYGSAPALKIARLAVSIDFVRQGLGKQLIQFAAFQAQRIRQYSGVFFLTLDCYEHRVSFYESLGFVRNLIQPVTLPYDSPISMRLGLDTFMESLAVDRRAHFSKRSKVSTPPTSRQTLVVRRIFLRKMRLHRSGCRSSPQKVSLRLHCSLASALTTFRLATNFLQIFPLFRNQEQAELDALPVPLFPSRQRRACVCVVLLGWLCHIRR